MQTEQQTKKEAYL